MVTEVKKLCFKSCRNYFSGQHGPDFNKTENRFSPYPRSQVCIKFRARLRIYKSLIRLQRKMLPAYATAGKSLQIAADATRRPVIKLSICWRPTRYGSCRPTTGKKLTKCCRPNLRPVKKIANRPAYGLFLKLAICWRTSAGEVHGEN
jgi:hypothetical protein